jgi:CheY-like chemotaxis protein
MDMRMPEMNGMDATTAIKRTEAGKTTPIIAITAHAFQEEREAFISAGCDDFVSKPFDLDEISTILARHLPVLFSYADAASAKGRSAAPGGEARLLEALAGQPRELLDDLEQAIVILDAERIASIIDGITDIQPDSAAHLAGLARDFQYETLQQLINTVKERRES